MPEGYAVVAGTFDTKGDELRFLKDRLAGHGIRALTVDLSTSGAVTEADIGARTVAGCHPEGADAVFTGDRGRSVSAMAEAFAAWTRAQPGILAMIGAGGSGGTTLATAGMRALGFGVPKIMVSTLASGDVSRYVGAADIMMMHSVADIQGINRITARVLGAAADALAGMILAATTQPAQESVRPAIGMTMFGVTTPCVQAVQRGLSADYDCLVFHATGTGGRAMERLADAGMFAGLIDLTTTEVADMIVGGILAADEDRFGASIRRKLPYVGSVGALDMVNFGPRDSVPAMFAGRCFVSHNANVTLMRTTVEESRRIGRWIGERLDRMEGPVRFLLPEGGVSSLDVRGRPFDDPEARAALFEAIEQVVRPTGARRILRLPHAINDPPFAEAVVRAASEVL